MKKLLCIAMIGFFLLSSPIAFAEQVYDTTHVINDSITINLPDDWIIIKKDMKPDDPLFTENDYVYDEYEWFFSDENAIVFCFAPDTKRQVSVYDYEDEYTNQVWSLEHTYSDVDQAYWKSVESDTQNYRESYGADADFTLSAIKQIKNKFGKYYAVDMDLKYGDSHIKNSRVFTISDGKEFIIDVTSYDESINDDHQAFLDKFMESFSIIQHENAVEKASQIVEYYNEPVKDSFRDTISLIGVVLSFVFAIIWRVKKKKDAPITIETTPQVESSEETKIKQPKMKRNKRKSEQDSPDIG